MRFEVLLAALGPTQGQLHRSPRSLDVGWILGAFIESHDDVGPETDLNLHRFFGAKKVRGAVEVRAKCHAFFAHLAQLGEAENLKPAGVGQDRPIPGHETVQAAHLPNRLNAWPQIKVVSISQQNLDAKVFQHILGDALHRTQRSHRHEYGGLDLAMRRDELPGAGWAASSFNLKLDRHWGEF